MLQSSPWKHWASGKGHILDDCNWMKWSEQATQKQTMDLYCKEKGGTKRVIANRHKDYSVSKVFWNWWLQFNSSEYNKAQWIACFERINFVVWFSKSNKGDEHKDINMKNINLTAIFKHFYAHEMLHNVLCAIQCVPVCSTDI